MRVAADAKVLVFARAPEAGATKTRLIPCLGAAGAAALQRILIERALRTALAADIGDVELWCAPTAQHAQFARYSRQFGVAAASQTNARTARAPPRRSSGGSSGIFGGRSITAARSDDRA